MRIQAIATLTTAAAVSFFGLQDPDPKPGLPAAVDDTPAAPFAWDSGALVETGRVEKFQDAGPALGEPDPFEVIADDAGFPAELPEMGDREEEPTILAESSDDDIIDLAVSPDDEIIDLTGQPDLVDVQDAAPSVSGIELADNPGSPVEIAESETDAREISDMVEAAIADLESPGTTTDVADEIAGPSIEEMDVDLDQATTEAIAQVENELNSAPLDRTTDEDATPTGPVESVTSEVSSDRSRKNRSSLDLVLDGNDAPIMGPVEPGVTRPEVGGGVPSVSTSVTSQLVDSVTDVVSGGQPDYEEDGGADQAPTMGQEQDGGGFWLKGARLNEVYQYLARLGGLQYFHNTDLDAANYVVTGHLGDGDPVAQMEELGLMYGVTVHTKGSTVYALTTAQIAQLPTKPFQYHLNYLRPNDIEQIKTIQQPVLTPGSGTVDYEQKTNTLIVIDNEQKIEAIKEILAELDQPKEQIAIETRILRITSSSRNRIGVDWESVLGDGLTFEGVESLNTLFNLPDSDVVTEVVTRLTDQSGRQGFTVASTGILGGLGSSTTTLGLSSQVPESSAGLDIGGDVNGNGSISGITRERNGTEGFSNSNDITRNITSTGSHLVLSPLALQATLRALNQGGLAQQESSPTLVTEDNEPGVISIIDRVPIIITTVSETTAGQNISEEVRYQVDLNDPTNDPSATREIGVTVAVTPTLLPDNTIRMALRPRSAQIVEFVSGQSGNLYPRVNESTVDTIARVPNGHSLLIGGFYEQSEQDSTNKVPVLGDVPGLNFLFKSTDKSKENTSLVFVVTPKKYSPVIIEESDSMTRGLHERHVLPRDHAWPDRQKPGLNYESNLGWTMGNILNRYPATPQSNPLHPDHPVNEEMWLDGANGPAGDSGQARAVQPTAATAGDNGERRGFFKKLFRKRQR